MNKIVWKFRINGQGSQIQVQMPRDAKILYFAQQDGQLTIWAEVDPEATMEWRALQIVGTGHSVPHEGKYIGSLQDGVFVWHLYDLGVL